MGGGRGESEFLLLDIDEVLMPQFHPYLISFCMGYQLNQKIVTNYKSCLII